MVDLPSVESREMILKTLLSKEKVEDLDFKELAAITEGYSGSDLKVCVLLHYAVLPFSFVIRCWLLALLLDAEFVWNSGLSTSKRIDTTRERKR